MGTTGASLRQIALLYRLELHEHVTYGHMHGGGASSDHLIKSIIVVLKTADDV
jgi:hypothetical protein